MRQILTWNNKKLPYDIAPRYSYSIARMYFAMLQSIGRKKYAPKYYYRVNLTRVIISVYSTLPWNEPAPPGMTPKLCKVYIHYTYIQKLISFKLPKLAELISVKRSRDVFVYFYCYVRMWASSTKLEITGYNYLVRVLSRSIW